MWLLVIIGLIIVYCLYISDSTNASKENFWGTHERGVNFYNRADIPPYPKPNSCRLVYDAGIVGVAPSDKFQSVAMVCDNKWNIGNNGSAVMARMPATPRIQKNLIS